MAIPAKPASLLLATDRSARSDRALARAVQLAAHWQADLVLLVAMATDGEFSLPNRRADAEPGEDAPPPQTPMDDVRGIAERQLEELGVTGQVRVVVDKPGPAAIAAATEPGGSGRPRTATRPSLTASMPKMARASSVRPAPTRPARPRISPRCSVRSTRAVG